MLLTVLENLCRPKSRLLRVKKEKCQKRNAGLSFKNRSVQRYTLDNNLAPNPPLYGDEFKKSFLQIFKHCIDVHRSVLTENDYDFWAVIFEDELEN